VKLRLGWSQKRINVVKVARICQEAGADAVGVHGRTREQHYKRTANWTAIDAVASVLDITVLGNGDLLTPWDLELRRGSTRVTSFLVARGALIKPWIFRELQTGQASFPTLAQRWAVMRRYHDYAVEYFGDDAKGLQRVKRFFLWHLRFWHRYRPYTAADWQDAQPASLIQMRDEPVSDGSPDATLLASPREDDHELIWQRVHARDYVEA
jgi:tRNA-dihydrouridine synthase 3